MNQQRIAVLMHARLSKFVESLFSNHNVSESIFLRWDSFGQYIIQTSGYDESALSNIHFEMESNKTIVFIVLTSSPFTEALFLQFQINLSLKINNIFYRRKNEQCSFIIFGDPNLFSYLQIGFIFMSSDATCIHNGIYERILHF